MTFLAETSTAAHLACSHVRYYLDSSTTFNESSQFSSLGINFLYRRDRLYSVEKQKKIRYLQTPIHIAHILIVRTKILENIYIIILWKHHMNSDIQINII